MTTTPSPPVNVAARQADLDAARMLLARLGVTPAELLDESPSTPLPTFADYIPVVSALVFEGTRRVYGTYWNRVLDRWPDRRLDEPTPTEIELLMVEVKAQAVQRRNARGGRLAAEHLVAVLRCLYRHAERSNLIHRADNPARKVDKPRRLESTAARSRTPGLPRSTRSRRPPGTIPVWTRCCCACTPRTRVGVAVRSRCGRGISTAPTV